MTASELVKRRADAEAALAQVLNAAIPMQAVLKSGG